MNHQVSHEIDCKAFFTQNFRNTESKSQRKLVQREIIKEEEWIKFLDDNIRNIV